MLNNTLITTAYNNLVGFFNGKLSDEDMKTLLKQMNQNGITAEEVVGFARAMRDYMTPIELPKPLLDVCGTGGSGKDRFNISTAITLLLGANGIPIAKHGNYGSKKPNGSFNFLEALGLSYAHTPEGVQEQFKELGYCFIFARYFHPALKPLATIRQEIGERTIFNLLGPLCNPASPTHQVIGTPSEEIAENTLVPALHELGIENALIIVGADGTDELALKGDNLVFKITKNQIEKSICNTESWHQLSNTDYVAGNSEENAKQFKALQMLSLNEKLKHPLFHHMAINAGAALYCFGNAPSIEEGYKSFTKPN